MPAKVWPPWAAPELARLREWWGQGIKAAAIARRLGTRTTLAVLRRARILGLARRQRPRGELMRLVARLARREWYDWEIALELDVDNGTVARARKRAGVPAADPHQSARARKRTKAVPA